MDSLISQNKNLENDLKFEQENNKSNIKSINQYEERINELQQNILLLTLNKNNQEQEQQSKSIYYLFKIMIFIFCFQLIIMKI